MYDKDDVDESHPFVVSGDNPIGGVVFVQPDCPAPGTVRSSRCLGCEAEILGQPVPERSSYRNRGVRHH
jgi:hypothetical protein